MCLCMAQKETSVILAFNLSGQITLPNFLISDVYFESFPCFSSCKEEKGVSFYLKMHVGQWHLWGAGLQSIPLMDSNPSQSMWMDCCYRVEIVLLL